MIYRYKRYTVLDLEIFVVKLFHFNYTRTIDDFVLRIDYFFSDVFFLKYSDLKYVFLDSWTFQDSPWVFTFLPTKIFRLIDERTDERSMRIVFGKETSLSWGSNLYYLLEDVEELMLIIAFYIISVCEISKYCINLF